MKPLLDAERMSRLDRLTIEKIGLPGAVLMETAGRAVFSAMVERFPVALTGKSVVVCGRGNNGGDGFVVARCLYNHGADVTAFLLGKRAEVSGDAKLHMEAFLATGGILFECTEADGIPESAENAGIIVDALFGTGLDRPVKGLSALWIEFMGASGAKIVSVDIPSGVCADTGEVLGEAVAADLTVTFGHFKKGHFLHPGAELSGELLLADIGIPRDAVLKEKPDLMLVEASDFCGTFLRAPEAHKGHFGHVVTLAGGRGKMGAAALSAWASLRSGAGLATCAFPAGLMSEARLPMELMCEPLGTGSPGPVAWSRALMESARALIERADAVVIGPGMGVNKDAEGFLEEYISEPERPPTVFDADALTILSRRKDLKAGLAAGDVITPHPGEAARLLAMSGKKIQTGREGSASELAKRYGCVAVLKGSGTLVARKGAPTRLVPLGNPGMATAGSGDVLAGVIAAFLARGLPPMEAATAGVWAHALAGDAAAEDTGMEGLTAGDILSRLPEAMRQLAGAS